MEAGWLGVDGGACVGMVGACGALVVGEVGWVRLLGAC